MKFIPLVLIIGSLSGTGLAQDSSKLEQFIGNLQHLGPFEATYVLTGYYYEDDLVTYGKADGQKHFLPIPDTIYSPNPYQEIQLMRWKDDLGLVFQSEIVEDIMSSLKWASLTRSFDVSWDGDKQELRVDAQAVGLDTERRGRSKHSINHEVRRQYAFLNPLVLFYPLGNGILVQGDVTFVRTKPPGEDYNGIGPYKLEVKGSEWLEGKEVLRVAHWKGMWKPSKPTEFVEIDGKKTPKNPDFAPQTVVGEYYLAPEFKWMPRRVLLYNQRGQVERVTQVSEVMEKGNVVFPKRGELTVYRDKEQLKADPSTVSGSIGNSVPISRWEFDVVELKPLGSATTGLGAATRPSKEAVSTKAR